MKERAKARRREALALILCILAVYGVLWALTGRGPFQPSIYNSYAIQAQHWLQGHLDLGQNYGYLEVAEYGGRYFISFPLIPSVLLPLCAVFGEHPPDTLLAVALGLVGALYALRMAWLAGREGASAVFLAFFVTAGSNFLHVGFSADVWYFAQSLLHLHHDGPLLRHDRRAGLRVGPPAALSLAFGCRPLQIVYLPLVALLLWQKLRRNGVGLPEAARQYWWWLLPPLCVGCGLMALNSARFGDPFQFGHDYLPEFAVEKENGQFSTAYLPVNWWRLWRLPDLRAGLRGFPIFDGCAFWLFSPIFPAFLLYLARGWRRALREPAVPLAVLLILAHLLALCCHATLGGWQFGNRYTVDALPALYCALMLLWEDRGDLAPVTAPLCLWGLGLNLAGTASLLNGWLS